MPLRDHFRSPLDDVHSWDGLYGGWPAMLVQHLNRTLPERYCASPRIHLGSLLEIDIEGFRNLDSDSDETDSPEGGSSVVSYTPPEPTLTLEPKLPNQDVYEVRIYDGRRNRELVAAIELVSPSNKDRPENREAFVGKVASLLKNGICVSIVDIVSTLNSNLYAELMDAVRAEDPALGDEPGPMYAVTLRTRFEDRRKMMDTWYHRIAIGQTLPTLPIWLTRTLAVSLELESSYEETCRTLRIR